MGKRMNANKRVKYHDCSDQQLIDLYRQSRDRGAVAELYERYRVSVGNFLYREIKDKKAVTDTFNSMMLQLIRNSPPQLCSRHVSTKLFSMAYAHRRNYHSEESRQGTIHAVRTGSQEKNRLKSMLASLPRQHRDIIELVYQYEFSIDEVANIIGRTSSVVRNCLSHIKNQNLPLMDDPNSSTLASDDLVSNAV